MPEIVATLTEVRPEAPSSVTLKFAVSGFTHRPGQYVEIDPHQFPHLAQTIRDLEAKSGRREANRPFSIASDALDPSFIELSIKDNPGHGAWGQLLTPFLVRDLKPGTTLNVQGPSGRYCLPVDPPAGITAMVHACAGSGVAPNRAMIRHALLKGWPQRQLLILQNRNPEDVFYKGEWVQLLATFPDRLRVRHVFSTRDGEVADERLLRREMQGWADAATSMAFACGPNRPRGHIPGFLDRFAGTAGAFEAVGIRRDRISTEAG